MEVYICKYCGKQFDNNFALMGHISHCKMNPNKVRNKETYKEVVNKGKITYKENHKEKYILKDFECICKKCGKKYIITTTQEKFNKGKYSKYCSFSCRNSHIVTNETKEKIRNSLKEYVKNNPIEKTIKTYTCKNCGKNFTSEEIRNTKSLRYCSLECKHQYLSKHTGGYRNGSGHGKSGWYKEIHCDSSWELAFVIYHIDNNLYIERCKEKRKYIYKNKEHIYIPDFITDNGIIEIKGYKTEQWLTKEKSNPDITTLYGEDLKFYLDYVKKQIW